MHLGPVCVIGVIGVIKKSCGTEASKAGGPIHVIHVVRVIGRRAGLEEISGAGA